MCSLPPPSGTNCINDSRLTTHDSRLTTHDSRLTIHPSHLILSPIPPPYPSSFLLPQRNGYRLSPSPPWPGGRARQAESAGTAR
ncbi:hypothetical protein C1H70_15300 [Halomonas urumqiensis]|uniref:Uncharacterized protein n=1 Tax=Halomonas urumqiensis TaxID=1684789 RepID=A0A2N7UCJ2_9GAMM|nr:hypothetical protein C1H70_15300 [Halomonas urumqiensis]